ncbi:DUF3471 domain-containing protein [Spirosoma gilvum]
MKTILTLLLSSSLLALTTTAFAQTTGTDSTALKAYAGSYTFESGNPIQKFIVTIDKGELFGEVDGYGKNKLLKQDKTDTFKSTSSYGSVITFNRDASSKAVTGFSMAIQGSTLTAKKD